jgi:hypothetical protein
MSRPNKGRLSPFVPLLKETLDCPAWRATSHGARSLYIALKRYYNQNIHNNGRIYLSQRTAAKEIGSKPVQVGRWFRELKHYGFIVMISGGCLGIDGKGQAPRWRLTEIGYMKDPPTRDFMRWNPSNIFIDKKKNFPVPEKGDRVYPKRGTGVYPKRGTANGTSVPEKGDKANGRGVPEKGDKSSIPLVGSEKGLRDTPSKLPWTTPVSEEVFGDEADQLRLEYEQLRRQRLQARLTMVK